MPNNKKNKLNKIPTIILCGGQGTRLYPDTKTIPKPLVTIGGIPIVVHLISYYISFGIKEFYLALGYKSEKFHHFFNENPSLFPNDITINLIDTGLKSMTGGRLLRLKEELSHYEEFMLTYGDGLSNVNLEALYNLHKNSNCIGTITAVHPPARFGLLEINDIFVDNFKEKPQTDTGWINGGFFVFKKSFFQYLKDDSTILEKEPLEKLADDKQLVSLKHYDFWQCMDTPRDRQLLDELYSSSECPWKI